MLFLNLSLQYIHSADIIHRVSACHFNVLRVKILKYNVFIFYLGHFRFILWKFMEAQSRIQCYDADDSNTFRDTNSHSLTQKL